MRHSAVRVALLAGIIAGSAGNPIAFGKPRAQTFGGDGSGCPGFSQKTDVKEKSIVFQLKNKCQKPIRCALRWEVSCGEKSEAPERHEEEIELAAGAAQQFTAQAACALEARWTISPATWSCHFKTADSDTASR